MHRPDGHGFKEQEHIYGIAHEGFSPLNQLRGALLDRLNQPPRQLLDRSASRADNFGRSRAPTRLKTVKIVVA